MSSFLFPLHFLAVRRNLTSTNSRSLHFFSSQKGYYRANHALARIARTLSKQLWRPAVEAEGIPFATLCDFMTQVYDWREQWLQHVGVPANSTADWDFISAISACA
jgi:hypothetical protein